SSSSAGVNKICAGPPTRNQVTSASFWFAIMRPRNFGICALKAGTRSGKPTAIASTVMAGLVPAIHVLKAWMPGTRPGMTRNYPRCDSFLLGRCQFAGQRIGPLRDTARAQKHDIVAGFRDLPDDARELFRPFERDHIAMPARADTLHQSIAIDTRDRWLTGGIYGRDDHMIGVVETRAELLEEIAQPRITMRLHDGDHAFFGRGARGFQHRADLDRMMRVVVEHRDAVPLA